MAKTLKAILMSIYCAVFLHSLKLILFQSNEDILQLNYVLKTPGLMRKIRQDIVRYRRNWTNMTIDFTPPSRFPTDLKFILIWNYVYRHPTQVIREGQQVFLYQNCAHFNCYITSNKDYLVDLRYFDALLFDEDSDWDDHPPLRTPNQIFVFSGSQNAKFYPICRPEYDNYFNITWTYRLDSDIRRPFITIVDKNGLVVGPRINMTWVNQMKPTPKEVVAKIRRKNKAVAWFMNYCMSKKIDKTQAFVRRLNASLVRHKLTLDIYGWCGNKKCPRGKTEECLMVLRKEYFFYLVLENGISADYVNEKILYPLQNYAVPIVYSDADYSRFLPPGSYIDAGKLDVDEVVSLIVESINNRAIYSGYFRWHNHYAYKEAARDEGLCTLCEILNEPRHKYTTIKHFRKWWNHKYHSQCNKPQLNSSTD